MIKKKLKTILHRLKNTFTKSPYFGPLIIVFSNICFVLSHGLVKYSAQYLSVNLIMFYRFSIPTFLLISFFMIKKRKPIIHNPYLLTLRAITGLLSMFFFYLALQHSQPGKANIIMQLSIIWTSIAAYFIFKERYSIKTIAVFILAVIGAFCIIKPGSITIIEKGDVYALIASFFLADVALSLKILRKNHDTLSIIFVFFTISTVILSATNFHHLYIPASAPLITALSGIGILSLMAQLLVTYGYKYTRASLAIALGLTSIPMMYLIGIIFFSESIDLISLLGIILLSGSLYYIISTQSRTIL